jgi:hypothetical protein
MVRADAAHLDPRRNRERAGPLLGKRSGCISGRDASACRDDASTARSHSCEPRFCRLLSRFRRREELVGALRLGVVRR